MLNILAGLWEGKANGGKDGGNDGSIGNENPAPDGPEKIFFIKLGRVVP